MSNPNPILVTGAAGFIGFHLAKRLLEEGRAVVGLDNLNNYYDVQLKKARLAQLKKFSGFEFVKLDIADTQAIEKFFQKFRFEKILHMAAQAGVRYSLTHPHVYGASNLTGFLNILEACRKTGAKHLVFASSSSVYGSNVKIPFSEQDRVDAPISLYAATKRANELMAHAYAHLYKISCTGLRYFTVYGPWGRPDMALFLFTKAILQDEPIEIFNQGEMERDFTYIDDVVEATLRILEKTPKSNFNVYNIGNASPVKLMDCIQTLEASLDKPAQKKFRDLQPGDVPKTFADVSHLAKDFSFQPQTPIKKGIEHFVNWYREYY